MLDFFRNGIQSNPVHTRHQWGMAGILGADVMRTGENLIDF